MQIDADHKRCPRCGEVKPISEFHRNAARASGVADYCKKCIQHWTGAPKHIKKRQEWAKAKRRERGLRRQPILVEGDRAFCRYCSRWLPISEFHKNPATTAGIQSRCKACTAAYQRALKQRKKEQKMPVEKFTISLAPETYQELAKRGADTPGERSGVIARCLDRYFSMLAVDRRDLADLFSDAEISLVCDALNGVWLGDQANIRLIWASVEDAIQLDCLDQKWGAQGPALVAKLRGLNYGQLVALADAVEVWWQRTTAGETPPLTVAEVFGV